MPRALSFCIGVSSLIAGCSTVVDPAPLAPRPAEPAKMEARLSNLPAQTLAPGECGLFGWTTKADPAFIFFATEDRGLYLQSGTITPLTPEGEFPAMNYGVMTLSLGPGDAVIDAIRYPSARLQQTLDDGFVKIEPVVIIQSCQSEDGAGS